MHQAMETSRIKDRVNTSVLQRKRTHIPKTPMSINGTNTPEDTDKLVSLSSFPPVILGCRRRPEVFLFIPLIVPAYKRNRGEARGLYHFVTVQSQARPKMCNTTADIHHTNRLNARSDKLGPSRRRSVWMSSCHDAVVIEAEVTGTRYDVSRSQMAM